MTESDFQTAVVEYARLSGYRVHHTRAARTEKGWRTPIQGDAGFPDLVLAGRGRLIFVELKSEKGRVPTNQQLWLDRLRSTAAVEVFVWSPKDWGRIEATL